MNQQNLNLYHIFHEVAVCGNISAAARSLFISQPAISKAILKLEHNLSTTLFFRSSKGVRLTEDGALLFKQSDAVMQVTEGINQISGVVQNNSATAQESAAASQELSAEAASLKRLVDGFTLARD